MRYQIYEAKSVKYDAQQRVGMIEFEVMCLPPLEYEAIRLRYVKYGVAKGGYWERIAQQMHVSIDWAKTLERQGVDRLIGRIAA